MLSVECGIWNVKSGYPFDSALQQNAGPFPFSLPCLTTHFPAMGRGESKGGLVPPLAGGVQWGANAPPLVRSLHTFCRIAESMGLRGLSAA